MKTSGFREIDFSKTECKNCGVYAGFWRAGINYIPPKGKIYVVNEHGEEDCPVCKGTGFIDESVTTELELENDG